MPSFPDWLDADRVVALANFVAVLATVVSLAYTRAAREQRHQGLLPILVATTVAVQPGATEEDATRRLPQPYDRPHGVRIENAGPGVALDVAATWTLDPALPRGAVTIDNAETPTAVAPGTVPTVRVAVSPRELARLEQTADLGGTASREVVATLAIRYADVYGRCGRTDARLLLASVGLQP